MAIRQVTCCVFLGLAALGINAREVHAFGDTIVGAPGITYFDFFKIAATFSIKMLPDDKKNPTEEEKKAAKQKESQCEQEQVDAICQFLGQSGLLGYDSTAGAGSCPVFVDHSNPKDHPGSKAAPVKCTVAEESGKRTYGISKANKNCIATLEWAFCGKR